MFSSLLVISAGSPLAILFIQFRLLNIFTEGNYLLLFTVWTQGTIDRCLTLNSGHGKNASLFYEQESPVIFR